MNKILISIAIILLTSQDISADALYDMVNGDNAYSQRDFNSAIRHYQRALVNNPDLLDAKVGIAKCYAAKGNDRSAEDLLNQVLGQNPYNSEGLYERARLYVRVQKHEQAIIDFNAAIQADPNNADAYEQLADLLFFLGQVKEAKALYAKAESLQPAFE